MKIVVDETNSYTTCMDLSLEWKTNVAELRTYLGLVKESEIWGYWAKDPIFTYHPIADKISRRFEEISRYLHFANTNLLPKHSREGYHRLQCVKPVIDTLQEKFLAVYRPGVNISVDEAMMPFKSKHNSVGKST